MSFAAVQKHVAVLERAGLVTREQRGRERLVRTDPAAVQQARDVLDRLEKTWLGRIERMSDLLIPQQIPNDTTQREDTTHERHERR
ncbi:hypothetical protein BH09ACT10_BH09ACT10_29170 [soil metagenome]